MEICTLQVTFHWQAQRVTEALLHSAASFQKRVSALVLSNERRANVDKKAFTHSTKKVQSLSATFTEFWVSTANTGMK